MKKIWNEFKKPENITQYIVYGLLALLITFAFQNYITPHPSIDVKFDESTVRTELGEALRIRITNVGSKSTENLQFKILYGGWCIFAGDEAELKYINQTKKDFTGKYEEDGFKKKWLMTGVELNPGVEISFICLRQPTEIRVSGANFKEVVKKYDIS